MHAQNALHISNRRATSSSESQKSNINLLVTESFTSNITWLRHYQEIKLPSLKEKSPDTNYLPLTPQRAVKLQQKELLICHCKE